MIRSVLLGVAFLLVAAAPMPAPTDVPARVLTACRADIQRLCAGREGDDVGRCLHQARSQVSQGCRAAVDAARITLKEVKPE